MLQIIRSLATPLLSLAILFIASGFSSTFVSIRLEMEGFTNEIIGAVTASLYVGILLGSLFLDRWINKIGHIRSFITFAGISTVVVLAQSCLVEPYYWMLLRFVAGICTAGILIVIESWILMQATPSTRGETLSIYLAISYMALSGGQLLIRMSDPMSLIPFYLVAFLSALSIIPLLFSKVQPPKQQERPSRFGLLQLFKISPFGCVGGIVAGMILSSTYGLIPAYAKEVGLSVSEISTLMALLVFGGFCLQWPIGRLSDRGDRRKILIISSLFTCLSAIAIAFSGFFFLLIFSFIFGGFAFTIYPLSMAYVCEKLEADQIVSATGGFILAYGIGAISGPLIAPIAMNILGSSGLFYFLAFISFTLALTGLKKWAVVKETEDQ